MTSAQNEASVKALASKIKSADNAGELLPDVADELKELFNCEAVTIYSVDRAKRQIVSRNPIDGADALRLDISTKSLTGYVCSMGKSINIANAYSKSELSMYHSDLGFGSARDRETNFKTKSILVLPLPHNKKLIGVLELLNKQGGDKFSVEDQKTARELSASLGGLLAKLDEEGNSSSASSGSGNGSTGGGKEEKILSLSHAIHAAKNVDEILLELKDSILEMFDASLITIYALDQAKNEIYSKIKSGDAVNEIRVPLSTKSIAGCVGVEQKLANIKDVYDEAELKKFNAALEFDSSWDQKSGIRTKSVVASPLLLENQLMGVIQLINKKGGGNFTEQDEKYLTTIAETLGLAFHNQSKFVQQRPTKFSHLINNGLITEDELTTAIANARKNQLDIETILLKDLGLKRKDVGDSLENFYGKPYQGYSETIVLSAQIMTGLNKNFLLKNFWIPLDMVDDKVVILMNDPTNMDKIQNIKMIFVKKQLEFKVGLKVDIIEFLSSTLGADEQLDHSDEFQLEEMSSLLDALKSEKENDEVDTSQEVDEANAISETDSTIVKLVNKVLTDAYDEGVSDIHIEPGVGKETLRVRYRKDGACRIYEEIPYIYKQAIISRIKIMSRLDIAERRLPQDGKIKMKYGKNNIEYRVATCPTVGGNEDAVLRILAASKPIPLENMNFAQRNLGLTQSMVQKPYGLVLVVGPTGSGKTTTLHSCLGYINTPEKKIWTAEDPVEITQKGLRQVQMLNKIGLDFSRAMRSFLRGDPDVIMVGEMRDSETCAIGLEASLTGHLVFSTLHTNSAPETITRLLDMGMNPLNFADALLLIIAQRLVRTLCKKCKEEFHPPKEEFDILEREYGEENFPKLGIQFDENTKLMRAVGCPACGDSGYAGRTGLHELLEGTATMKKMIMQKSFVEELREQSISDGMTTLKQDGIYKVTKGDCDLKMVLSVCIQ